MPVELFSFSFSGLRGVRLCQRRFTVIESKSTEQVDMVSWGVGESGSRGVGKSGSRGVGESVAEQAESMP